MFCLAIPLREVGAGEYNTAHIANGRVGVLEEVAEEGGGSAPGVGGAIVVAGELASSGKCAGSRSKVGYWRGIEYDVSQALYCCYG